MITDESFEQVANLDSPKTAQYAGNGWTNDTDSDESAPRGAVELRSGDAYSGNVYAAMTIASNVDVGDCHSRLDCRDTEQGFVALKNRGLYHQGYALQEGNTYVGYIYLRCVEPTELTASFTDDFMDVQLASAHLSCTGDGIWARHNFSLTPSASTTCALFPEDTAPLDCPADTDDSCLSCGGSFVLTLRSQLERGAQTLGVDVDAAYLAPGSWGRWVLVGRLWVAGGRGFGWVVLADESMLSGCGRS